METSIRELKAHLSEYVRRASQGEIIKVTVHGREVARPGRKVVARAPGALPVHQGSAGVRQARRIAARGHAQGHPIV